MRHVAPLIVAVFTAACGDNAVAPDARIHPDSHHPDSHVADAHGPSTPSRVWVIGDWKTDMVQQAGGFDDGAMLPFGGANAAPPLVVPSGTAKLATTASQIPFDASLDGTKIVFLADSVTTGHYDLYAAAGDGSSPVLLVSATATTDLEGITISPDGTKVAYTSDPTVAGGYDLFVVDTTGSGTPTQVSPARLPATAALDVFFQVTWSADSKYLAFSGDLTVDNYDEAYCVDTTAATPTAAVLLSNTDILGTTGSLGVRGQLLFDHADNVYFRARVSATSPNFQLFQATPDGMTRTDITSMAGMRTDASTPDIGAFAISHDGKTLAFSADAPTAGNYDIYATKLATPAPVNITNLPGTGTTAATVRADFTTPMWFAPDNQSIAFVANFMSARREPYVAAIDGSGMMRLVSVLTSCGGCGSPDVDAMSWTEDGAALYAQGDITSNNDTKLYRLDATMTDQAPTLAVDVPANGDITESLVRPKP